MWVKRIGKTTDRVTQGVCYQTDHTGRIMDDNHSFMTPCLEIHGYWVEVDGIPNTINASQIAAATISASQINYLAKGEPKMGRSNQLTIEKVTLVNGRPISDYSSDDVIRLVQQEEAKKKTLSELPQSILDKSKAIQGLIAKHDQNIEALIEVLDQVIEQ